MVILSSWHGFLSIPPTSNVAFLKPLRDTHALLLLKEFCGITTRISKIHNLFFQNTEFTLLSSAAFGLKLSVSNWLRLLPTKRTRLGEHCTGLL